MNGSSFTREYLVIHPGVWIIVASGVVYSATIVILNYDRYLEGKMLRISELSLGMMFLIASPVLIVMHIFPTNEAIITALIVVLGLSMVLPMPKFIKSVSLLSTKIVYN